MNITRKDATISNTGPEDAFPGSFEVVLSTSAKDRDGDELAAEDWDLPLPSHITFDQDHGMSVAATVGSGVPHIDEQGRMIVNGTYSSLPRAQEVRTLVNEGHIRSTSVAFLTKKLTKDGKSREVRELLNGAFVAIPSNTEAAVLGSKAGARHSTADAARIQSIYDHAVALGAGPSDDTGAAAGATGGKAIDHDSAVTKAQAVGDALAQVLDLFAGVDDATRAALPEPVREAIGLLATAELDLDGALAALGVPEPETTDQPDEQPAEPTDPAAADQAAPATDDEHDALVLQFRSLAALVTANGIHLPTKETSA